MKPVASVDRTYTLLVQSGIHPKRQFGQNFLIDHTIVKRIVSAVQSTGIDFLVEIGPGFGALTEELLTLQKPLQVIEIDHHLAQLLPKTLNNPTQLSIAEMDVMKFDFTQYEDQAYALISNLPYYITSDVLELVLLGNHAPQQLQVMMQKEVAMKYLKPQKTPDHALFLILPYFYEVTLVTHVSKNSFFPRPAVDSTVLSFIPKKETNKIPLKGIASFIQLIYQQRRKTLMRRLIDTGKDKDQLIKIFSHLNLSESIRADELQMSQWLDLIHLLTISKEH